MWEKAVWGIFCGNWKAVLPVAESWEDEIWIYLTCYVDIATEKAIAQSKPIFDESGLPMDIWESRFVRALFSLSNCEIISGMNVLSVSPLTMFLPLWPIQKIPWSVVSQRMSSATVFDVLC